MRRGFVLLGIVLLVAASAAARARADGGGTTTTDTATTDTTTTSPTSTTSTTETTTTTTGATYRPLVHSRLLAGCVGAGVAAISVPGRATVVFLAPHAGLGASEYPKSAPFLTFDSARSTGAGCAGGHVALDNVSLFGGAVTARSIWAQDGTGNALGLELGGRAMTVKRGETVAVGNWGLLTLGAKSGRLSAPLALRLVRRHGSLPKGTVIYVAFAALPEQHHPSAVTPVVPHHPEPGKKVPQPLKWTPRLGIKPTDYVFPVDGGASYIDTYGAGRNDIYDGWHHGDDLFAPLGTPVVAVANGTISPIGWDGLGGWRLWLTDKKGNSFYYAHLAGYSRFILENRHVKAGQVIGFLGRTGDAFTTTPHLHFEIHPHNASLVALGYDGAVDPTTYLESWRIEKLPESKIPPAVHLHAPAGQPAQESAIVWKELLKARHLMPDGEQIVAPTPSVRRPFPAEQVKAAAVVQTRRLSSRRLPGDTSSASPWPAIMLGLVLAALAAAGSLLVVRRRRSA